MRKLKQNIWITLFLSLIFLGTLGTVIPKNADKYLGDRFWSLKANIKTKYNLIALGDSRTYRGISPADIENILPNIKAYNFGFSNGGLNATIFNAAEEKLIKSDSNKIILLGVTAFSINELSKSNKHYLQELTRPKEEIFERIYFGKILNYFSPTTPEKIRDLINDIKPEINYISIHHDNGWVESEKIPKDTMHAIPYYKKDFSLHTTNYKLVDDLCHQIRLWDNKGIKVFAYRPPAAVPLITLEDSMGNYNESIIKQKIENAGGCWIYIDPTKYKTYDGSHLQKEDARRLSRDIASRIKGHLTE